MAMSNSSCRCAYLCNKPFPTSITNDAATEWIEFLRAELGNGFGFVPFIGAGLSVPSGAPVISQLAPYLEQCIARVLGIETTGMLPRMRSWNPRTDQWPPFTCVPSAPPGSWLTKVEEAFKTRRSQNRSDPELPVFQEAIGAMAEWRTALLFLARITRVSDGDDPASLNLLALDAPRQEVIDAGIREIMKGREPNLGHRMLAALAVALRLDVILTTNFDELLERAFESARNPLTVFELHLNSTLPPWSALSTQRSLVKLHGNRHSLRADYTLDVLPSESDCRCFLEYLLTAKGRAELSSQFNPKQRGPLPFQNHLLMLGFSARERRTRSFVEYAWTHLRPDFKVFWLCHSSEDVEHVRRLTHNYHTTAKRGREWQGSYILRFPHIGLLFLHVFQAVRRGIPTNGVIFPAVSRLALPPMPRSKLRNVAPKGTRATERPATQLRDAILNRLSVFNQSKTTRIVLVTSPPTVRGVTTVCSDVYQRLEDDRHLCLWIDMNEVLSTDDLFDKLLDAAYYRLGTENWTPVFIADSPKAKADELRHLAEESNSSWVVFLNARDTPGANAVDHTASAFDKPPTNGWIDDDDETSGSASAGLVEFLAALCRPEPPHISVVILCCQADHTESPFVERMQSTKLFAEPLCLAHNAVPLAKAQPIAACIKWTNGDSRRGRFLHALVLMQRPRFLATIWSRVVLGASPPELSSPNTYDEVAQWLAALEANGLIRFKPGGFIWIHSFARNSLRSVLGNPRERARFLNGSNRKLRKYFADWKPESELIDVHDQLCQWYRRILDASGAHAAIFEAVYHACMSAKAAFGQHAIETARDRIELAASLLRTHGFLLQTRADSRGNCRYLAYIRADICGELEKGLRSALSRKNHAPNKLRRKSRNDVLAAVQLLRIRCTETMRAIAREIGEDGRAFLRHREGRAQLADESLACADKIKSRHLFAHLFSPNGKRAFHASRVLNEAVEWIRWWRWAGMLGLASRSYREARKALNYALLSLSRSDVLASRFGSAHPHNKRRVNATTPKDAQRIVDLCLHMNDEIMGRPVEDWQQVRLEALRVIEQIIAVELDSWSVQRRTGTQIGLGDLLPLRKLAERAIELVEQVVAHDHAADAHATTTAMWCKSRILMHDSICLCVANPIEDSWRQAIRLLADAETCLRYSDPRRHGTDRATLELYRAEVRLLQADHATISLPATSRVKPTTPNTRDSLAALAGSFAEMRHHILNRSETHPVLWRTAGIAFRTRYMPDDKLAHEGLRIVKTAVSDSIRFLTRAEKEVLSRRRHLWWNTRFACRKLTAIAMSVWSTVLDDCIPIPFLGLEAAPRGTPTIADSLLTDSLRMIRVDSYRLATIVEAYAACATALHCRLMLDKNTVRLADRQQLMHLNLSAAVQKLRRVHRDRITWEDRAVLKPKTGDPMRDAELEQYAEMDPAVITYVKNVLDDSELIASALGVPQIGKPAS